MNGITFRGVCQYLSTSGAVMCEVGPGQFFGDLPMIFEEKHLASVRSKTNVEVIRKPTRVFFRSGHGPLLYFYGQLSIFLYTYVD